MLLRPILGCELAMAKGLQRSVIRILQHGAEFDQQRLLICEAKFCLFSTSTDNVYRTTVKVSKLSQY